jgi:VIT1/CCC1 family predicted Fe2+/Mn2+ transporter
MVYSEHSGNERAYIRDIILGINDGMISTLLLTIGVYASGLSIKAIILTIISSSVGGMISMGLGEYLATKSQVEVTNAELKTEKEHIDKYLDVELEQVKDFFNNEVVIKNSLVTEIIDELRENKESLFNFMKRIEFGVSDEDHRNPIIAMCVSGMLFFVGALPTIVSFCVSKNIKKCFYYSLGLNTISLFTVGAIKTKITKGSIFLSGLENLFYGALGGVISYFVGYLFSMYLIK